MIYSHNGINWTWYLNCKITEEVVVIHSHYRLHTFNCTEHPRSVGKFMLLEEGQDSLGNGVSMSRIVDRAILNGVVHKVMNPKNVFAYKGEYDLADILNCEPCHDPDTIKHWMAGRPSVSLLEIARCDGCFMYERVWILIRLLLGTETLFKIMQELGFVLNGTESAEEITICLWEQRMDLCSEDGVLSTEPYQKHQLDVFIKEISNVLL